MRKLKLDLDAISVASFTTARSSSRRGTVLGAQDQAEGGETTYAQPQYASDGCSSYCWYFAGRGWEDLY